MSNPKARPIRLYLVSRLVGFLPESRLFSLKRRLYRLSGLVIGDGTRICSSVVFSTGNVRIGRDVWIGPGCRIMMPAGTILQIEDNVDMAMDVLVVGGSHEIAGSERRAGPATRGDITIGRGAWIGARCVLLHGVAIGAGSILATGSVAKGDIAADHVYAGNPAKPIRSLDVPTNPNTLDSR